MKDRKHENQKQQFGVFEGIGRFFIHFSFCWLAGLTGILQSYATPESWTEGTRLSLGSGSSRNPAICSQGNEIFVAWSDNRLGRWVIFFRYSLDGGITWQREQRVTRIGTDSTQPAIACDQRRVHFVWSESSSDGTQCRYTSWDRRSWSSHRTLSNNGVLVRHPKISVTNAAFGNWIAVVWEGQANRFNSSGTLKSSARKTAFITQSRDGGRTWLRPHPITPGDWNTSEPNVAGGLHSVYVTWSDQREDNPAIFVKRWDGVKASHGSRVSLSGICGRPSIAVFEPHVYVAWQCRVSGIAPANVFLSESADSGETWTENQQLSANLSESVAPNILVRQENAWLVWQEAGESANWEIRAWRRMGQQWSVAGNFTALEAELTQPEIYTSGNFPNEQLHLVWENRPSLTKSGSEFNTSDIFYRRLDTLPPNRPSQPVHLDSDALPGFDNDSRLTFSWKSLEQSAISYPTAFRYYILVSVDGGDYTEIGSTNKSAFEFESEDNVRYRVAIQASDSVGNRSELSEPSLPVFVDRNPPYVRIHLPNFNSVVTRSIPVIASCVDSNLVECRLRFGKTASPQTWTQLRRPIHIQFERERLAVWDTSNLDGIYTVALTAVDEAGNRTTASVPLIIDNVPPLPLASTSNTIPLIDATAEVFIRTPVWSPDGQRIAFSSNEGGAADIWMLRLSDNSRHRLTRDLAVDVNPAWHPDSERLIFQSRYPTTTSENKSQMNTFSSRGLWEIWTIRTDRADHRVLIRIDDIPIEPSIRTTGNLPSMPLIDYGLVTPAWSPTGEQIAFAADVGGDLEIWVVQNAAAVLSGAQVQAVPLTRNTYQDAYPAWAPDASQIAYQSQRNGNSEIALIDIDGSSEKLLRRSIAHETRPAWSPNGKTVLFLSGQGEHRQFPFTLNLRDGRITQISPILSTGQSLDFFHYVESADWSPDGKAIVYQSSDALYVMPLEFPEPPIEARLERPVNGEQVQGKVNLFGIARGRLFQNYRLEFASNSKRNEWHLIGGKSTAPVNPKPFDIENANSYMGDFLGQWDARELRGAYVLRLVAVATTGDEIEERVKVYVENEYPRLVLHHPPEGLHTTDRIIIVNGRADKQSDVTLNGAAVRLDEEGEFEWQLLLTEAKTRIELKAKNTIGLETNVYRTVYHGFRPPEFVIESPHDYAILNVPYVTVSGHAHTADVQLKVNDVVIPLQSDRRFSRILQLREEAPTHVGSEENLIRVEAVDRNGRRAEVIRRVIYERNVSIQTDVNPPGIAEVFPPYGTVLTQTDAKITAILIDDDQIAPSTIQFTLDEEVYTFDGTEGASVLDGDIFDFNPLTGQFAHKPPHELVDGLHTIRFEVQDNHGNSAESVDIVFFIDTQPFNASISAKRTGDVLNVFVDSNKRLAGIPSTDILPSGSSLGYTLNLNSPDNGASDIVPDGPIDFLRFRYEGEFRIAPSQRGFSLSATVQPPQYGWDFQANQSKISLVGYFTDQNRFPELSPPPIPQHFAEKSSLLAVYRLFIEDGPDVVLFHQSIEPDFKMTLRSQSGLDQKLVSSQHQNAVQRRLSILPPVYTIETNNEKRNPLLWITLPIPQPGPNSNFPHLNPMTQDLRSHETEMRENADRMVLFWWDPRGGNWIPLDTTANQFGKLGAVGYQFGSYALLTEHDPPIIHSIRPEDGDEVVLSRFLVEAVITDIGSGVDSIRMRVDGRPVQFHYDRNTSRVTYIPSGLNAGKHTLDLTATDRANNAVHHRQDFFTSDNFNFVDVVTIYPNPTMREVKIGFNLTHSADVTLKIYDAAGQLVHTVEWQDVTGKLPGVSNEKFIWNCENQAGESVASGVYIYILEAARGEQSVSRSGKFAVVR